MSTPLLFIYTLKAFHNIIFNAFDREEEHFYEFQIGGREPNDPAATRYGLKMAMDSSDVHDAEH